VPARPQLRPGALTALLALAAVGLASLLADLGTLHRLEHGDSLVPVLVSLQRWTPFYWDQERYGMLVPLLAWPVREPLANLLLQRWLTGVAGLGAVLLLARRAAPGRAALPCGLLAAALFLALVPAPFQFEYLADQPYGLSLCLGLGGLALAERRPSGAAPGAARLAGAALLLLAAHWVNAAVGLFLGPVVVASALADRAEGTPARAALRQLGIELSLTAAGLAAGQGMLWLYPVLSGHPLRLDMGTLPAAAWPGAWGALLANGLTGLGVPFLLALAGVGVLGLCLPWRARAGGDRPRPRRAALLRGAALVAAALAYALANGTLRWVSHNVFHWRYLAPSAALLAVAATALVAEPLSRAGLARAARAAAAALVPAAALLAYGPPSLAGVRADLDARLGRWTPDVLEARCDLVAGDYWSVWPAVWHAGWVAGQRGVPAPYGITHRTNPTVRFWSGRPRESLRICRVRGVEAEAERWLRAFHLWPVRTLERRATVDVVAFAPWLPDTAPAPEAAQVGPVRSEAGPMP
jgi:hypothetical protein